MRSPAADIGMFAVTHRRHECSGALLQMQINKNPATGRLPLGEADVNAAECTLHGAALTGALPTARKTPRSAARPPPVARAAAPPPPPPPMPAKGALIAGNACAQAPPPAAPPLPPKVSLNSGRPPVHVTWCLQNAFYNVPMPAKGP